MKGLTERGASSMMFDKDGSQMSVAAYFDETYHIKCGLPAATPLRAVSSAV